MFKQTLENPMVKEHHERRSEPVVSVYHKVCWCDAPAVTVVNGEPYCRVCAKEWGVSEL